MLHCFCIVNSVHSAHARLHLYPWHFDMKAMAAAVAVAPLSPRHMVSHTVYRICGKRWRRIEWRKEMVKWIVRLLLPLLLPPLLREGGEYYTSCGTTGFYSVFGLNALWSFLAETSLPSHRLGSFTELNSNAKLLIRVYFSIWTNNSYSIM